MKHGIVILLALLMITVASAGVVRNVSDSKTVSFDWPMPIGDGSEILVATSSNQFAAGGNPNHGFQISAFDPTTGIGTLVTSFSSGSLVHTRHNLSVSDDGQWLAFISDGDLVPGQNGNRSPELFVVKRDGTMLAQLTDDPTPNAGSISRIAMAGSANRIAFASSSNLLGTNPGLHRQVYLIDRDGMNLTQMTNVNRGDIQHMWISDDGTRIAFAHNGDLTGGNPENNHEIFTIAMGDTSPRQVTSSMSGESQAANISGDGGTIVFHSTADLTGGNADGGLEIFAADWATATISQVTSTAGGFNSRQGWPTNDGTQIFYASNAGISNYEIFKINTNGTGNTQLTTLGVEAEHPVVSGDGSQFAYWTDDGLNTATGTGSSFMALIDRSTPEIGYADITADGEWLVWSGEADPLGTNADGTLELFVQKTDGTQLTQVTASPDRHSGRPMITADGSRVYFESTEDYAGQNSEHKNEIFGIDVDGSNPVQLTECDTTTWFSGYTGIPDNHSMILFSSLCNLTGGNADNSAEIFRVDPDGSNLTQLTFDAADSSKYVYFPRLDATGTWVTFSGTADVGGGSNADGSFEVWRMQTDGTNLEQLTSDPVYHSFYADISLDGSRIVFVSEADLTGQNTDHRREIFLYEPATTTTTQLTHSDKGENGFPRISGNGAYVYFTSDSQHLEPDPDVGRVALYRIHIDSSTLERAGGFGFEPIGQQYWPEVDTTGDHAIFNSTADPTHNSPDTYWDIFVSDYSEQNPVIPSPGPAPTSVEWEPEPGMLRYDVIRGDVANLQHDGGTVDLGAVVCLEDDSGDTTTVGFEDPDDPAPGQAFFYLFRGQMGLLAGGGTYGSGTGDFERIAGTGDCQIAQLAVSCGNGIAEFTELCDGTDLGGGSCLSQGFEGGTLACNVTCDGYDTSMCATCGDNVCQAFAGEDCLSCAADCNGEQGGNPNNRYCCGDGDGDTPVPCSDPRCTASGNTCVE